MLGEDKDIVLMMRDNDGSQRRVRVIRRGREKGWFVLEAKQAGAETWKTIKMYPRHERGAAFRDCLDWTDESA